MLERTDAITNEVLEPITFVLAYPTVYVIFTVILWIVMIRDSNGVQQKHSAGSIFTGENRTSHRILVGKLKRTRPFGRHRYRYKLILK